MTNILYIATGGAAGALLRYWMSSSMHRILGQGFPYGTLTVNVTGSIIMGLCYVFLVERVMAGMQWRAGLMIGLLGAFTTFSSFSIETMNLLEAGQPMRAGLNILLSVTLCMLGCWLGMAIGRQA